MDSDRPNEIPAAVPLDDMLADLDHAVGRAEKKQVIQRYLNKHVLVPLLEELGVYQDLLIKGKGEWGEPGYVRDETWQTWIGARVGLQKAVGIVEGFKNA